MKKICVFCGSSPGKGQDYLRVAEELGNLLMKNNIGLVYGGGDVGMMGKIARTVFEQGGEVIGVIPRALADMEVAYTGLTDLRIVESMHDRKALMAGLSDAFIALPGGLGTLEEYFEVITWAQLSIHNKPCGLLNTFGYYDFIIKFLDQAVEAGFIKSEHRAIILVGKDPEDMVRQLRSYRPLVVDKAAWILSLKNT